MPNFKVFSIEETDMTSSERMAKLRNQTIYCNIKDKVDNNIWKNTRDIIITENNGEKEISKIKSYDMMNKLHKGFYSYKQDISGYCFENNVSYNDTSNNAYQQFDILYSGYTKVDMTGVIFDTNNLCNLTTYYSMVKIQDNTIRQPNKYQKIYKFPTRLLL